MQRGTAQVLGTEPFPQPLRAHITSKGTSLGLASLLGGIHSDRSTLTFLLDSGKVIRNDECEHHMVNAPAANPIKLTLRGQVVIYEQICGGLLKHPSHWYMRGINLTILSLEIRELEDGTMKVVGKFIEKDGNTRDPDYKYIVVEEDTFPPYYE